MIFLYTGLIISLIAFILIPGAGGVKALLEWRKFRKRIMESALLDMPAFSEDFSEEFLGLYRFSGRIEALQSNSILWIKGEKISIQADMSESRLFSLPYNADFSGGPDFLSEEGALPEEPPKKVSWKNIMSLQEGLKVYLIGFLKKENGIMRMFGTRNSPLTAVFYEKEDVVPMAVWSGRQKNEYWNPVTPWSLLAGSLSLFILAMTGFRLGFPGYISNILLTMALFPITPFLPPGVVLFFIYIGLWRKARLLRAKRDLLKLNAFVRAGDSVSVMSGWEFAFPENTTPLIKEARKKALFNELAAVFFFSAGFSVNAVLLFIIIQKVL